MLKRKLILASASPRRQKFLKDFGYEFDVILADIVEKPQKNESPWDYVARNAREKAFAALKKYQQQNLNPNSPPPIILAADTIVVDANHTILEKPKNAEDAIAMLKQLSGNEHYVLSAYTLVCGKDEKILHADVVKTTVKFRNLTQKEIEDYVASGEPFDKAGAYGIQEKAASFVQNLYGSYTNVVGLPLAEVIEALRTYAHLEPSYTSAPKGDL